MDWIPLAQNLAQWETLVNMVMNHPVLQKTGSFMARRVTIKVVHDWFGIMKTAMNTLI